MTKPLKDLTYREIVSQCLIDKETGVKTEYGMSGIKFSKLSGPQVHLHKFFVDHYNSKSIEFTCSDCGDKRTVLSPNAIPDVTKERNEAFDSRLREKRTNQAHIIIPKALATNVADSYQATAEEMRADLLQPFNQDGSINEKFVKKYGTKVYNILKPNR